MKEEPGVSIWDTCFSVWPAVLSPPASQTLTQEIHWNLLSFIPTCHGMGTSGQESKVLIHSCFQEQAKQPGLQPRSHPGSQSMGPTWLPFGMMLHPIGWFHLSDWRGPHRCEVLSQSHPTMRRRKFRFKRGAFSPEALSENKKEAMIKGNCQTFDYLFLHLCVLPLSPASFTISRIPRKAFIDLSRQGKPEFRKTGHMYHTMGKTMFP